MKTYSAKVEELTPRWWLVDAEGQVLGRLASQVASILRGKNNPEFTPHADCGDFVVIVNAQKVRVTGNKARDKVYRRHTGYPGGFREERFNHLVSRRPTAIIERAVRGMLPHTSLGRHQFTKLKVYAGPSHPHQAQKPEPIQLNFKT